MLVHHQATKSRAAGPGGIRAKSRGSSAGNRAPRPLTSVGAIMAGIYKTPVTPITSVKIMTTTSCTPAHGEYTDNGRPKGFSSLTPFVALKDPKAALAFYTDVFGARVVNSTEMDGTIIHAELDFGCGRLQLGAAQEAYHLLALDPEVEDVQFSLSIYVPNVDSVVETAIARGAVLREPVEGFVSGDRYGSIRDPFGIRWSVMTRVEDLSDEESARRVDAWATEMSNQVS